MKKYSKLMAVLLVVAMLLPGIAQAAPVAQAEQAKVMRIAGDSRVGTSIKVSEVAMDSATDAVLVGYSGEADALTGAIVAKAKNAPLFYVRDNEVEAVKARLDDLGVANVHVLGGTTVFTEKLMKEFDAYNPVRIDGDNRYETAINAAKVAVGDKADTVFLAKGNETLADALSIGAISAKENTPLLLTHGTNLTEVTKQALKDMEVKNVEIIGGKSAVSEEIKNELEKLGYKVDRTSGDNRQATSVEIAKKFNPDAKEIVIANGFDYADAVTAGYFAAGKDAVVLLINQNVVHPTVKEFLENNKLDTTVLGGPKAIAEVAFDKVVEYLDGVVVEMPEEEEPTEELAIESVSAINAKTLAVTFNQEVVETGKAEFEVKRGASKLSPEVTWNADKTEAHLEVSGKLAKGKYEVTVTGLTEEALTGSTEVENETVAEVKVLTTEAPLKGEAIKVKYQFLNQYGEDITDTNIGEANVTSTKGTAKLETGKDKGTITISSSAIEVEDKITVVVVDKKTGKSATGAVEVVDKAILDTIELGDVYNAKDEVLSEDNKKGQYVLVSGKDQYGNDFDLVKENITVISTKQEVATFELGKVEIDDKEVQAFAIDVKKEGTTTLRVVSNNSGKSADKEITVEAGVKADTITFGEVDGTVSGSKTIKLPIEIVNNKGELIKDTKDTKDVKVSVSNLKAGNKGTIKEKDGSLYIEFVAPEVAKDAIETVVVTVTTATNKTETKVLTVQPDAVKTELVGVDSKVSFDVLAGKTLELNKKDFIVNDQYGDRIKYEDNDSYNIIAVTKKDDNLVETNDGSDKIQIKSKAASKNETVKFVLAGVDPESSIEKRVTIVTESEFDSYEVKDIGLVQVENDKLVKDIKFEVKATTASGKVVTLTGDDYSVSGKTKKGEVVEFKDEKVKEITLPVTITINATGETIKKDVIYSNAEVEVQEFIFTEDAITEDADLIKAAKEFTGVEEVEGKLDVTKLPHVLTTDQYGNKAIRAIGGTDSVTIVPTDVSKVTIEGSNGTSNVTAKLAGEVTETTKAEVTVKVKIGKATEEVKVEISPVVVNNEAKLTEALADSDVERIILGENITLSSFYTVTRANLVIDGNGKAFKFADGVAKKHLRLNANNITLKNLVQGENHLEILVNAKNVNVIDNKLKAESGVAVYFNKVSVSSGKVVGNTINADHKGIGLDTTDTVEIKGNIINFKTNAIELFDGASGNKVTIDSKGNEELNVFNNYTVSGNTYKKIAE